MKYAHKVIDSSVGKFKLVGNGDGLAAVLWENDDPLRVRLEATGRGRPPPGAVVDGKPIQELSVARVPLGTRTALTRSVSSGTFATAMPHWS